MKTWEQIQAEDEARYHPCDDGLHFCGIDEGGDCFYTAKNIRCRITPAVRAIVESHGVSDIERLTRQFDIVVDFMINGSAEGDVGIRRQSLALIERDLIAAAILN